jgi:hypothetical protein
MINKVNQLALLNIDGVNGEPANGANGSLPPLLNPGGDWLPPGRGITELPHKPVDIASKEAGAAPPAVPAPKHSDNALFYDVEKHGRLEIGEALYLYTDGTFEKVKYG